MRMDDTQRYVEDQLHVGRGQQKPSRDICVYSGGCTQFLIARGRGGGEFCDRQAPPLLPDAKGLFYRPAKSWRTTSLVIQVQDKCSSLYFVFPKGMNQTITSPEATQRVTHSQK